MGRTCFNLNSWTFTSKTIKFIKSNNPAKIYLLGNNRNTSKKCEICSKLTTRIQERRYLGRSDTFAVNFEHISHLFLVFLLLALNK